jgi:SAM-dependent methyltransferase
MLSPCRICQSENTETFSFGNTLLLRCNDCGIIFNNNFPDKITVENYYKYNYSIDKTKDINNPYILEEKRVKLLPEQYGLISKIISFKNHPARLLDIGCGFGFFIDEARRFGFDSYGVEPSVMALNYCHSIGLNVFDNIDKISTKFDIITLFHSLEHFIDPKETIDKIKNILTHDGFLFIRVPAFDCYWSKILKSKWVWFQPENHYFHYSLKSLQYILALSNLKIIEINYQKPSNKIIKSQ